MNSKCYSLIFQNILNIDFRWTQNVNRTYTDIWDAAWTSYANSIYTLCPENYHISAVLLRPVFQS